MIEKVEAAISNFNDLLKNLEDKIFTLISEVNLPETLAGIKRKINDIIEKADLDAQQAKECLSQEHASVTNLAKNVVKGVRGCMDYTEEERKKIREGIRNYITQGEKLIHDVHLKIHNCIKNHISVPKDFFNCLENIKESSFNEMIEFIDLTASAVEKFEKHIAGLAVDLGGCIHQVVELIKTEEIKIIENFVTCIDKIVQS